MANAVISDPAVYSRYIVAWMLSRKENSALSSELIAQAHERYGIEPRTLTCIRIGERR